MRGGEARWVPKTPAACQGSLRLGMSLYVCFYAAVQCELDVQNKSASPCLKLSIMYDPFKTENSVDTLLSTLGSADGRTGGELYTPD